MANSIFERAGKFLSEKVWPINRVEDTQFEGQGLTATENNELGNLDHTLLPQNRLQKYSVYEKMDIDEVEFALDIIADSICQQNDFGAIFQFELNDSDTGYNSDAIHSEWDWFTANLELDDKLWQLSRDMCKFGDVFYEVAFDNVDIGKESDNEGIIDWQELPKETMSIIVDEDNEIIGYEQEIMDDKQGHKKSYGSFMATTGEQGSIKTLESLQKSAPMFAVEQILHFKLSGTFFGKSILEKVIRTWMNLKRLEDSMIIYRIVRAPERRIFYISTGRLPAAKSDEYLQRVKQEHSKRKAIRNIGANNIQSVLDLDIMTAQEDYYIPVRNDGQGSKVETLPGGSNLSDIDDVLYFKEKLFSALKIPPSYLSGETVYNDGRVGIALQREIKFAKYIERIQRKICKNITELFESHLALKGYDTESIDFRIFIETPSSYKQTALAEVQSVLLNNYSQASGIDMMSKVYAMRRYLQFTDDEIRENLKMLVRENNAIKINEDTGETILDLTVLFPDEADTEKVKICFKKGKPKLDDFVQGYVNKMNLNSPDAEKDAFDVPDEEKDNENTPESKEKEPTDKKEEEKEPKEEKGK